MSLCDFSEKMEQLIFDENRIVTYKVLSRLFKLHVNKAKQLLYLFIKDRQSKGFSDLTACYVIAGIQISDTNEKIHKFTVIPESKLEATKEKFSELTSVHVYSIQKGKSVNVCSLYTTDLLQNNSAEDQYRFSAIKYADIKVNTNKIKHGESAVSNKSEVNQNLKEIHPSRKSNEEKVPSCKTKTNGLFTMWQKKEEKKIVTQGTKNNEVTKKSSDVTSSEKTTPVENKTSNNVQESTKTVNKSGKNNMKNFFSKQTDKSSIKSNEKKATISNGLEPQQKVPDCKEISKCNIAQKVSKDNQPVQRKQLVKKQKLHDLSESESDEEKPKRKKRRRIIKMVDSDSESECEEELDKIQRNLFDPENSVRSEKVISEDEEDPIPPTPPPPQLAGVKHKKLKAVTKMFEDEDGFLVTKIVKEYVSASEDSENEETMKRKVTNLPKSPIKNNVKSNFVNKKQVSLMSFFKQK